MRNEVLQQWRAQAKEVLSDPRGTEREIDLAERIILLVDEVGIARQGLARSLEEEKAKYDYNESCNFEPVNLKLGFPHR